MMHEDKILSAIKEHGKMTISELSQFTGLSRYMTQNIVKSLLDKKKVSRRWERRLMKTKTPFNINAVHKQKIGVFEVRE